MKVLTHRIQKHWELGALIGITLLTRLYLLRVYDIELSQDGFEAVRTLTIWQTQGIAALPHDLLDRALLHPLYMLVLAAWRVLIPAPFDFYLAARFLSTLFACVAVVLLFQLTRDAYGRLAAWCAALFLVFAPSFLWESIAILSSTLFLALYLAVLRALLAERYARAFALGWLAALVRYEGVVLIALAFVALLIRDLRARQFHRNEWWIGIGTVVAFPLTLVMGSVLATGNPLQFIGAQSMASIWLRFLAPGDFFKRGAFFITQYPALFPSLIVWLGVLGVFIALLTQRTRATMLLLLTTVLYVIFFELLVFFNYTTLETRFLMYPGLSLLIFAGVALASVWSFFHRVDVSRFSALPLFRSSPARLASHVFRFAFFALLVVLLVQSYQQGERGLRFVYNSQISMREMAAEIAQIFPKHQRVNVLAYGGTSGALDFFARQYGLELAFTEFRFAPDDTPEQYLIDHQIEFVIYPVGNAFAKAKYPYLMHFETQTHDGVTFQPIVQFATASDNQLYSLWAVTIHR